jgi:CheY-like chemotaxis protein
MTNPQTGWADRLALVVEDDVLLTALICTYLKHWNVGYMVCGNGRIAIEYLRKNPKPALLLTDLEMPVMDGRELLKEMAADPEWRTIPVAIVSAYEPENLALPHVAYLGKPVDFGRLLALVTEHCS